MMGGVTRPAQLRADYIAMGRIAIVLPRPAAPSRRRVIQEGLVAWSTGKSMRCQNCSAENPQGAKFCIQCATPFQHRCHKCGFENPSEARFCAQCAAPRDAAAPIRPVTEPHDPLTGERRHLTVLFCDLVGSTEIVSHLDPEEWREIVAEYHHAAAQAIERFGGHVAQYLGDGVVAFFGYPEAHDNDAERGARAGLGILDAISKLNEHATRPKLSARIGIDSGAVVVGAGAGKEADVFGDTPNLAARVQAAAAPDTVLITAATHRLVSGLFVVEDRGAQALKGIERPVQLYRVVQPSGVRGRLEAAAAAHALTPFVGREDELRLLMNRWERALDDEGQVALIMGEAGIGKSRLAQHFHEQIAGTPHTWVEAAAGAFFQNTPFYAVTQMLRELLAWRGDESAEEQLAQLEPSLVLAGLKPAEALPLIAPLLNLPLPAKYPPSSLSPEQQRRRLLATLVEWALGAARVQPIVIAIEDLHWADPSTLELLQLLVEQGATARLLLLYTARPEFRAQWPPRAHHTQLTLNRLSSRNVRTMVGQVAAQKALTEETVATVIERTGGVPLFVEELTRAVLERGDAGLTGHEIPVTLHDSLMARLDRLGPAKEVIQTGAVIGGEFSYELLHAVHPVADEDLQRALHHLADAELLYVRGIAPEATYLFKHALIRDAAYEALLRSRRKELHRLVARTIDEKFPALKEAHPEVLARHWMQAGETEPAIAEWSRAGKAAEARNAFSEALESYQQAVVLLNLLPESPERDLRELELRQSVHGMLWLARGPSEPETIDATERAASLAEKSGNLAQLIKTMITRGNTALDSGDLPAAGTLADQALELALREGSPTNLGGAHALQMMARYYLGDLDSAEKHFTAGLTFFDLGFRQAPGAPVGRFGFPSLIAWMLGRADVARERMARAIAAAIGNNPFDVAHSGYWAVRLHVYLREYEKAEISAARALELSEKHHLKLVAALSRVGLGEARAQLGRATEGIALIRQGIAGLLEIGSRLGVSRLMAGLAEAQEREGAIVDALETVEQALRANPHELVYRPETLRLRGELRLKQGQTELAEADVRDSIALAQKMGAKAWELRASTSLARLLAKHGRRDEARTTLAEIYGWFTEGFDTADLKYAKALLDELSG
jgi:class 3 adenylate cyclase/tetratricopeptide (TPR) repeat protein